MMQQSSKVNLDDAFLNVLLGHFEVPVQVQLEPTGHVHVKTRFMNVRVSGRQIGDQPHVRLKLYNWPMKHWLLQFGRKWLMPERIKDAVHFESSSEIDIFLEKLPHPAGQVLEHLIITGIALPGDNGAALSVHFQLKD